ncbi:MAG TPA: hypothetical protein PKL31_03505 [Fulvivirga sp.]|nr:hypothetical protein [Fulvivirga sp.]
MNVKLYLVIGLCTVFILLNGCKSSDDPVAIDPFAQQTTLLENNGKPWISSGGSIIKDGYDVSSQFNGFKLSISGNQYSTVNSLKDVWGTQGSWSYHDNNINVLERNDGVLLTIKLINNELTITFTDPKGSSGGSLEGISGDYIFELVSE